MSQCAVQGTFALLTYTMQSAQATTPALHPLATAVVKQS